MKKQKMNLCLIAACMLVLACFFDGALVYGQRNRGPVRIPNKVVKVFDGDTQQWQQQYLERGQWLTCRIFNEETGQWVWIIDGDVPGARITSWNIPQPPSPQLRPIPPHQPTQQRFRLVPGDVILEINGEWINGQEDATSAIARSPQTMHLTVRDGRSGVTAHYVTSLNSSRPRFGVNHRTHSGGGSRVTGVNPNSPATRIYLVE